METSSVPTSQTDSIENNTEIAPKTDHNNLFDIQEEIDKVMQQDKKEEEEKLVKEIQDAMDYNMNHYQAAMNNALKEVMEGTSDAE